MQQMSFLTDRWLQR